MHACTHQILEFNDGDAVIARAFELVNPEGITESTWAEDATSLGTHPEGAPLLTIDEIYERCESEVLIKDPAANWITLTLSENGVLQTCSYFPKSCADDCATGFSIDSLELL